MVDKKFFRPAMIKAWLVVIYERQQRFGPDQVRSLIQGLRMACKETGIAGFDSEPVVRWENGQSNIENVRAV